MQRLHYLQNIEIVLSIQTCIQKRCLCKLGKLIFKLQTSFFVEFLNQKNFDLNYGECKNMTKYCKTNTNSLFTKQRHPGLFYNDE